MGHGRRLTKTQVATVLVLHVEKDKPGKIAVRIGKSRTAVRNVLGKPKYVSSAGPPGRPSKLTELQARLIVRNATTGWRKRKSAPKLTTRHKSARISWARNFPTSSETARKNTVYIDEKHFCLDGPDGLNYCWADL